MQPELKTLCKRVIAFMDKQQLLYGYKTSNHLFSVNGKIKYMDFGKQKYSVFGK